MPTDILWALGAVLAGLGLSRFDKLRPPGLCLAAVGVIAALLLGRMHVLEPTPFEVATRAMPGEQARALDWVRLQVVPGETVLTDFEQDVLPRPRLAASVLKAFWDTGYVDLLAPETRFLIYDTTRTRTGFRSGLSKRWLRPGPAFGTLQTAEIVTIPRVAATSQPPFRTSFSLGKGPFKPGALVRFRLEAFNATNESRRLGWIEVRVDNHTFTRLAGYNPLPAHTGEVVELVFVAPDKPGGYQVTVEMPNTASGEPEVLKRKAIEVKISDDRNGR